MILGHSRRMGMNHHLDDNDENDENGGVYIYYTTRLDNTIGIVIEL